jgi:DNA polymerase III psi subunit
MDSFYHPTFLQNLLTEDIYSVPEPKPFEICIVVENSLQETDEHFLHKILTAVQLDMQATKTITSQEIPDQIWRKYAYKVIFFGQCTPDNLQELPLYTLHTETDMTILVSDSLAAVQASQEKKKLLWVALQKMFA